MIAELCLSNKLRRFARLVDSAFYRLRIAGGAANAVRMSHKAWLSRGNTIISAPA